MAHFIGAFLTCLSLLSWFFLDEPRIECYKTFLAVSIGSNNRDAIFIYDHLGLSKIWWFLGISFVLSFVVSLNQEEQK